MTDVSKYETAVKHFLRMNEHVTMYDEEIRNLISSALSSLRVAGVKIDDDALITDYICTYVRLRMLQDASDVFRTFEKERELIILTQLKWRPDES